MNALVRHLANAALYLSKSLEELDKAFLVSPDGLLHWLSRTTLAARVVERRLCAALKKLQESKP